MPATRQSARSRRPPTWRASANASASVSGGVIQDATGTEAELNFDNSGSFTVSAIANADGDSAQADATVDVGVGQYATASAMGTGTTLVPSGDATVSLTNSSTGSISILADANALADLGYASAFATVDSGVSQYAFSENGDASVAIVNAGALSVIADASAAQSIDVWGLQQYQRLDRLQGPARPGRQDAGDP